MQSRIVEIPISWQSVSKRSKHFRGLFDELYPRRSPLETVEKSYVEKPGQAWRDLSTRSVGSLSDTLFGFLSLRLSDLSSFELIGNLFFLQYWIK